MDSSTTFWAALVSSVTAGGLGLFTLQQGIYYNGAAGCDNLPLLSILFGVFFLLLSLASVAMLILFCVVTGEKGGIDLLPRGKACLNAYALSGVLILVVLLTLLILASIQAFGGGRYAAALAAAASSSSSTSAGASCNVAFYKNFCAVVFFMWALLGATILLASAALSIVCCCAAAVASADAAAAAAKATREGEDRGFLAGTAPGANGLLAGDEGSEKKGM